MPIYKLEPIRECVESSSWEATSLNQVCWINARSEDDARITLEGETLKMVDRKPGQPMTVFSPWRDPTLVRCTIDDPGFVNKEGVIFLRDGRLLR